MATAAELRALLSEIHAIWLPREGTTEIRRRIERALAPTSPNPKEKA